METSEKRKPRTPEQIIKNIRYRRWQFKVEWIEAKRKQGTATKFFEIWAYSSTVDADFPQSEIEVTLKGVTDMMVVDTDEPTVVEAIFALITKLEAHERREFFLYGGKKLYDPHLI